MTTAFPGGIDSFPTVAAIAGSTTTLGANAHSTLHANLGAATTALERALASARSQFVYATDYGLGGGVATIGRYAGTTAPSDGDALRAWAVGLNSAKPTDPYSGGDFGVIGVLPNGSWTNTVPTETLAADATPGKWGWTTGVYTPLTIIAPPSGDVHIVTAGVGGTIIKAPSSGSPAVPLNNYSTATFTTLAVTGNQIRAAISAQTVPFLVGDPIAIQGDTGYGYLDWMHFTVTTDPNPDSTHVCFNAGENSNGTDTTNIKNALLTYGGGAVACPKVIHRPAWIMEPLGFGSNQHLYIWNLQLLGVPTGGLSADPNQNQYLPSAGFGLRRTAQVNTFGCSFSGLWAGDVVNGGPHGVLGTQGTNHFVSVQDRWINCHDGTLWLSNDSPDITVGGGRDYRFITPGHSSMQRAHHAFADDGAFQTVHFDGGANQNNAAYSWLFEGVLDVCPGSWKAIDGLQGRVKTESSGNSNIHDRSRRRLWQQSNGLVLRFEGGMNINGEGGSDSHRPWAVTGISMTDGTASPNSLAVLTATIVNATNIAPGDHIIIGPTKGNWVKGTVYASGDSVFAPSVPTVTGVTSDLTANTFSKTGHGLINGQTVRPTAHLVSTGLTLNDTYYVVGVSGITFQLALTSGGSAIDLTGSPDTNLTLSLTLRWVCNTGHTATASGAATGPPPATDWDQQLDVDGVGIVDTVSTVSNDQKITMRRPDYTDVAVTTSGAYTGSAGESVGFRMGAIDGGRIFLFCDQLHDTATDTLFWFDLGSPATGADVAPGGSSKFNPLNKVTFEFCNNSMQTSARRRLPRFRFNNTAAPFQPMSSRVVLGGNTYAVRLHDPADTIAIPVGGYVVLTTNATNHNQTVRVSVAADHTNRLALGGGIAMTGSPASGGTATVASGAGTAARVFYQGPVVLCTMPGTELGLDDPTTAFSSGAITEGQLVIDSSDSSGSVTAISGSPPTAGQRVVGRAITAAASNKVSVYLCEPYWTA